jgi:hypothetical protein
MSLYHHQVQQASPSSIPMPDKLLKPMSIAPSPSIQVVNMTKPLSGVAVTVMLHSPKWFQRRYTMLIQNTVNNLPENWKVQIFYTGKGQSQAGLDINPGISRHIRRGEVVLTLLPKSMEKIKKYQLMFQPWFWENMLADRVLLFGGNSVVCSNSFYSINDFIQYDYLGAPWHTKKGVGGDGGISIRNRDHMLRALEYKSSLVEDGADKSKAFENWGQEDHFYVDTLLEMNRKNLIKSNIAPRDATYQFAAIGNYANETVLVASGTLPDVPFMTRDKFLQYCPELKMVYPSLHDPNCFGASPNGEECAKSICALRPKTERKGGC